MLVSIMSVYEQITVDEFFRKPQNLLNPLLRLTGGLMKRRETANLQQVNLEQPMRQRREGTETFYLVPISKSLTTIERTTLDRLLTL